MLEKGALYIVATPIGNLSDISARAREVLNAATEVWVEDTRHSKKLFQHLAISPRVFACHDHNESQRVAVLLDKLRSGASIALISDAGTPLISDPGYRLVHACRHQGFTVRPVPGASAVIAALSVSGLPTDRFVFEGFLPGKATARKARLGQLVNETRTLVFYESSHRIKPSVLAMCEYFGVERRAVVARELTKLHETVLADTLGSLSRRIVEDCMQQKGEFVVAVAGAEPSVDKETVELQRVLRLLLPEMSAKRAAVVAAQITGVRKNQAYRMALAL